MFQFRFLVWIIQFYTSWHCMHLQFSELKSFTRYCSSKSLVLARISRFCTCLTCLVFGWSVHSFVLPFAARPRLILFITSCIYLVGTVFENEKWKAIILWMHKDVASKFYVGVESIFQSITPFTKTKTISRYWENGAIVRNFRDDRLFLYHI